MAAVDPGGTTKTSIRHCLGRFCDQALTLKSLQHHQQNPLQTENFEDAALTDDPLLSVAGWLQGAVLKLDQGRVAILGEAAMCTAQFDDPGMVPGTVPEGINAPQAAHNAQFCLNVVRWLTRVLEP